MEEIQHFSHRHPLSTIVMKNEIPASTVCDICLDELERDSDDPYGCKECNFYIHKSCAAFPRELQHPSHPKHLLLLQLNPSKVCANCSSDMFQFKYTCPHCQKSLYLCPKCAFLPLNKTFENHDHPLTLMRKSLSITCDACDEEHVGMFYICSTCSVLVHSKCTSLPLIVRPSTTQVEIHVHPLTLMPTLPTSLTCNACGNEIRSRFYYCATCLFVAHLKCALLPSILKVKRHKHPLNLILGSLLANLQSKSRVVCQLCAQTVNKKYGLYYCSSSHDFVSHIHCATDKEERDQMFVTNSKDEESIESFSSVLKHTEGDKTELHTEINHFSHNHNLKLTNEYIGSDQKYCDACIRSIFPAPFYACAQCGFFLHKSCAELPRKLRHSLHQHPLKLLFTGHGHIFHCYSCGRFCDGFKYHCDECNFNLDVGCSLIPDIFIHPSHKKHELILARSYYYDKCCSGCGSIVSHKFSCVDCKFILCFKCLTLPSTIRYKKHDHPFKLCYLSEDDSGEYYCDICEKIRDPKDWYYYCDDCNYPAHPKCILGDLDHLNRSKRL